MNQIKTEIYSLINNPNFHDQYIIKQAKKTINIDTPTNNDLIQLLERINCRINMVKENWNEQSNKVLKIDIRITENGREKIKQLEKISTMLTEFIGQNQI